MKTLLGKKLFFRCLIFSIFCFSNCDSKIAYEKETTTFNSYLKSTFAHSIPVDKHIYCISQTFECAGCTNYTVKSVSKLVDKKVTVITTRRQITVADKITVLYDKNKVIDKLNLGVMGTILIFTESERIKKIYPVNTRNLEEIDTVIENFYNNDII